MRWAALAAALVGCFLLSVAAGGILARQLRSQPTPPPVAVASPANGPTTPASALTTAGASPTQTETLPSATPTAPLESPRPTATSTAVSPGTPQASPPTSEPSTPPASELPSATPTGEPPPSEEPVATPTVAVLDPATAEEFTSDLAQAINSSDNEYLLTRLHPAVIERYGLRQCRGHIRTAVAGHTVNWQVQSSAEPAPWDYASDGLSTTIADTTLVTVTEPPDTGTSELHFAPADGTWRWFTDCGTPV